MTRVIEHHTETNTFEWMIQRALTVIVHRSGGELKISSDEMDMAANALRLKADGQGGYWFQVEQSESVAH